MIENEFEYIEFLKKDGLKPKTAYSYGRYLTSVSNYLKININRHTISSTLEVKNIIARMSGKYYAESYVRNCHTALKKYLSFLDYELNNFRYPEELLRDNTYIEGA